MASLPADPQLFPYRILCLITGFYIEDIHVLYYNIVYKYILQSRFINDYITYDYILYDLLGL